MSKFLYIPLISIRNLKAGNCFLAYPKNSYQYLKLINYLESRNYKFYIFDDMVLIKKSSRIDNMKIKKFLDNNSIEWKMGYISSSLIKVEEGFKIYEIKENS